jgi:hypothetical protein
MRKIISQDLITPGFKDNYRGFTTICILLILIGVVTFLSCVSGHQAQRVWLAYLINYLFWSGLAFAAILFVAVINMTNARWARPLKRIAEAPGAFLPVSFLLFWCLYFGRHEVFPWIRKPVEGKEVWLNPGFLFARDGAGLFSLQSLPWPSCIILSEVILCLLQNRFLRVKIQVPYLPETTCRRRNGRSSGTGTSRPFSLQSWAFFTGACLLSLPSIW